MRRCTLLTFTVIGSCLVSGCGHAVRFIGNTGDKSKGITYYIGGAGPIGNVGSIDIPNGLKDAGYEGAVEIFTWQGFTHAGDQINLSRNRSKAAELATKIRNYRRKYPNNEINIIALSAGTGIATFALEYLPQDVHIDQMVFLGCSLSSRYDLTRALRRVVGNVYVIYSPRDPILGKVVWYTGTVDRASASEDGIAGLRGFRLPHSMGPDTERQYSKLHNIRWRDDFSDSGYDGLHTDSTKREFIRRYIGPLIRGNDELLIGRGAEYPDASIGSKGATSRPSSAKDEPDSQVSR